MCDSIKKEPLEVTFKEEETDSFINDSKTFVIKPSSPPNDPKLSKCTSLYSPDYSVCVQGPLQISPQMLPVTMPIITLLVVPSVTIQTSSPQNDSSSNSALPTSNRNILPLNSPSIISGVIEKQVSL